MNTGARPYQFRVQFWSGFHGTTWASYGRERRSSCSSVRNPSVRADLLVGLCHPGPGGLGRLVLRHD